MSFSLRRPQGVDANTAFSSGLPAPRRPRGFDYSWMHQRSTSRRGSCGVLNDVNLSISPKFSEISFPDLDTCFFHITRPSAESTFLVNVFRAIMINQENA
ncbi:unnamed protein product [Cercospora beticola]|nr:unnamed protein product [Cercospora beticola]